MIYGEKNMKTKKLKYLPAIAALAITLAIIGFVVTALLFSPNKPDTLADTPTENIWSYEILKDGKVSSVYPVFEDKLTATVNDTDFSALCMKITLPEITDDKFLNFSPSGVATEVFIENYLAYSNIDLTGDDIKRNKDGFLEIPDNYLFTGPSYYTTASIPISPDFSGNEMRIYTYYTDENPYYFTKYPSLADMFQKSTDAVVGSVGAVILSTLSFIAAIALCLIFFVRTKNGHKNYKILLMILFLILFALRCVCYSSSQLQMSSKVLSSFDFSILSRIYVIPIVFFVAFMFTNWRKFILLVSSFILLGTYCICYGFFSESIEFINFTEVSLSLYFLITVIMLVLDFIFDGQKYKKYKSSKYILLFIIYIFCGYTLAACTSDSAFLSYGNNILGSIFEFGEFAPLNTMFCTVTAIISVLIIIKEFIDDYTEYKKRIYIVNERARYALQSYQMLKNGEKETKAARHEMNHHMVAISAMLDNNDTQRPKEYIEKVTDKLSKLPKIKYCDNILINSITGIYAEIANDNCIKFECSANVPEQISIADEDLCVFLENMFDNAIEACLKTDTEHRFIKTDIKANKNFLFISCSNCCFENFVFDKNHFPISGKSDKNNHGYGIIAMNSISEKYNSILIIDCTDNVFTVKTNMSIISSEGE